MNCKLHKNIFPISNYATRKPEKVVLPFSSALQTSPSPSNSAVIWNWSPDLVSKRTNPVAEPASYFVSVSAVMAPFVAPFCFRTALASPYRLYWFELLLDFPTTSFPATCNVQVNAYNPEVGAVNIPEVLLYPFPRLVSTVSQT